jgi:hypothetical protein
VGLMLVYLGSEAVQDAFQDRFTYQMRLPRGRMDIGTFASQGEAWCIENIGPPGRVRLKHDTVLDTEKLWARFGRTFYFVEQNHAFWFKMVWL